MHDKLRWYLCSTSEKKINTKEQKLNYNRTSINRRSRRRGAAPSTWPLNKQYARVSKQKKHTSAIFFEARIVERDLVRGVNRKVFFFFFSSFSFCCVQDVLSTIAWFQMFSGSFLSMCGASNCITSLSVHFHNQYLMPMVYMRSEKKKKKKKKKQKKKKKKKRAREW